MSRDGRGRGARVRFAVAAASLLYGSRGRAEPLPAAPELPKSAVTAPSGAIVPPRLVSAPEIPYPRGAEGDAVVVLAVTVGATGTVRAVRVIDGEEPFVGAAVQAAPTFRFEPATRDGRVLSATIRFEVTFRAPPKARPGDDSAPAARARRPGRSPAPGTESAASTRSASGTGAAASNEATPSPNAPSAEAAEVVVHGQRSSPMARSMTRAEVRQLPGAFGDPFRAIEVLPGVTPIVSGLPYFYVRGAPPGNVGYFLDGVRVPYLYHVGLGPSVVHPAMVDRVELYPGGYPARFGRFAGGIVSGETTTPRDDLHGEGNIRILDAGALVETGFAGGRGTVLVGGRYSYTAAILSLVAKDVALDYRDYQVRATYDVTPSDRIGIFGFGSYDLLGQRQAGGLDVLFGSEFHRADLRYDHSFGHGSTLRLATTIGFDQTRIAAQRNATDRLTGARLELYHPLSNRVTLRAGADVMVDAFGTSQQYYADPDDPNTQRYERLFAPRTDVAVGTYIEAVFDVHPRIELTPGVRFDAFTSGGTSASAIDPRLAARFKLSRRVRLVEAYGLVHQPPSFVIPVPGLAPASLDQGLQRAIQASAGAEVDLPYETTVSASVFHNSFYNMTDALSDTSAFQGGGAASSVLRALEQRARGEAVGFEFFARRSLGAKLGGFLSYTLSRSLRSLSSDTFPSAFDRTHVASAALAYDLGKRWRAGARVVFYTGVPKTVTARGLIVPPPGLHPERDPSFFRLDLRLEKRWLVGSRGYLSLVFEVLNSTLSKETIASQTIGPVTIPSIGLEGGF
jgi:TonB family protein